MHDTATVEVIEALAAYGPPTDNVLVATKGIGARRRQLNPARARPTSRGLPGLTEAARRRQAIGLYAITGPTSVPWADCVATVDPLDEADHAGWRVERHGGQIDEAERCWRRLVGVQTRSACSRSSEQELSTASLGVAFIPGALGASEWPPNRGAHRAFAQSACRMVSPRRSPSACNAGQGSRVVPSLAAQPNPETHHGVRSGRGRHHLTPNSARLDAS